MLVGAGALDSPLEVTRFEFTIKSCRCTKTCEGVGTSDFCKAEIAPLPYMICAFLIYFFAIQKKPCRSRAFLFLLVIYLFSEKCFAGFKIHFEN